jgi:quinol monooxygenase YgiN
MFLRLVQTHIEPARITEAHRHYDELVIPALQKTRGCRYCSFMQSNQHPEVCLSLTLWESRKDADDYEQSGVFRDLVRTASQYFAATSDWKIHLSDDMKIEYEPVREEPEVGTYSLEGRDAEKTLTGGPQGALFVRIVAPQIRPESLDDFKRIYREEIIPALRSVHGCRYAELSEKVGATSDIISITVWNSAEDAEEYETSGVYRDLVKKLEPTFSGVYQWKKQIEKESLRKTVTTAEVSVEGYNIITGKSFV